MKTLTATLLLTLSGCAILTPATPSLSAYIAAHYTGITEATALMGGIAAGEQDVIGSITIKKDLAQ